jgi:hypothetical protein
MIILSFLNNVLIIFSLLFAITDICYNTRLYIVQVQKIYFQIAQVQFLVQNESFASQLAKLSLKLSKMAQ